MSKYQNEIRWGVVGCGQIAVDKSLPGLLHAKGAKLVAIADPLEARRAGDRSGNRAGRARRARVRRRGRTLLRPGRRRRLHLASHRPARPGRDQRRQGEEGDPV